MFYLSAPLLPDVLQLLLKLTLDYGQLLLSISLNLLLSLLCLFANSVQFLVPLCTDLVKSLVMLFPACLPVLIALSIASLATLGPNSIEKFWLEFWLELPPTLMKCSKMSTFDRIQMEYRALITAKTEVNIFSIESPPSRRSSSCTASSVSICPSFSAFCSLIAAIWSSCLTRTSSSFFSLPSRIPSSSVNQFISQVWCICIQFGIRFRQFWS